MCQDFDFRIVSPISAVAMVSFHRLQLQIRGGNVYLQCYKMLCVSVCVFSLGMAARHDTGGMVKSLI